MILDSLKNSALYYGVSPRMKQAFELIASTDWTTMEPGIHELDGKDIYVNVMERELKQKPDAKLEIHNGARRSPSAGASAGSSRSRWANSASRMTSSSSTTCRRPITRCVRGSLRCFSPRTGTPRWWARARCARSSSRCAGRRSPYLPGRDFPAFFVPVRLACMAGRGRRTASSDLRPEMN